MAANCFTLEAVKEFMINNGGRVTNQQLVTHFKAFLNDPVSKATHREKFKDFVNELATIKIEEAGKILVLKKKHRQEVTPIAAPRSIKNDNVRAHSEPPGPGGGDEMDGMGMSKVHSEEYFDSRIKVKNSDSGVNSLAASTSSIASSESQLSQSSHMSQLSTGTAASLEEDVNASLISVKDRAKHLNKIESRSDILMPKQLKKNAYGKDDDDADSHSSGTAFVAYTAEEKEWMLTCSSAEYHEMNRLLSKDAALAKIRDFTNGYTALHWAAKHGKPEVIKLLAGKPGVNINQRSYGGYTALHLAAMQGHEDIIELLVQNYKADSNIRDYSGKKAKQYLKNSASSRTQQLLLSRRIAASNKGQSLDDSFLRTGLRKSNRAKAISSLIQATASAVHRSKSTLLRSSWGSSSENVDEESRPRSASSSPSTSRKGSSEPKDRYLMPPPSVPTPRRNKSSSRESLQTQSASAIDPVSLSGSRSESDLDLSSRGSYIH